jgi:sugar (pentulose or hexulose) kinase
MIPFLLPGLTFDASVEPISLSVQALNQRIVMYCMGMRDLRGKAGSGLRRVLMACTGTRNTVWNQMIQDSWTC